MEVLFKDQVKSRRGKWGGEGVPSFPPEQEIKSTKTSRYGKKPLQKHKSEDPQRDQARIKLP